MAHSAHYVSRSTFVEFGFVLTEWGGEKNTSTCLRPRAPEASRDIDGGRETGCKLQEDTHVQIKTGEEGRTPLVLQLKDLFFGRKRGNLISSIKGPPTYTTTGHFYSFAAIPLPPTVASHSSPPPPLSPQVNCSLLPPTTHCKTRRRHVNS